MSLDLNKLANKLANKLDEALIKETTETLTKFLTDKRMSNNKQSSVEDLAYWKNNAEENYMTTPISVLKYIHKLEEHIETIKAQLPSDEEIEEKLNVAYGNGYEQGEMDFYKKMKSQGKLYADGYSEGYKRALDLVKWKIDKDLLGGNK